MKLYGFGSACVFKEIEPLEKLKCIWIEHEKLKEKLLLYGSCKQEQKDFLAWLVSYKGRMHTLKFASVEEPV